MVEWTTLVERLEPGAGVLCAVTGLLALVAALRIAPRLSAGLHRRALHSFYAALLFFVLAEALGTFESLPAVSGSLLLFLMLIHEGSEVVLVLLLASGIYLMFRAEREEIFPLRRSAEADELTSLFNRRALERMGNHLIESSRSEAVPLACVLMDVDDFKAYNDSFGHASGDIALRSVASVLLGATRPDDLVVRYGGEEFVVLTGCDLVEAGVVAERIREKVEERCRPERIPALRRPITVSVGVAPLRSEMRGIKSLLAAADEQMYKAKRARKNCVSVATSTP